MSANTGPVDQATRDEILAELDTNLFVEAGAGAGKTTILVGRLVELVLTGIEIEEIAAITFTEKAAAELRHRLRAALTEKRAQLADPKARGYLDRAISQLDHAPIGTLHAFARRLLNEFPIETKLPPGFVVLDEIESNIRFDDRWEQFLDELLREAKPDLGITAGGTEFLDFCEFDNFTVIDRAQNVPSVLRRAAGEFHANWDLVAAHVNLSDPGPLQMDFAALDRHFGWLRALQVPPEDKQFERRELAVELVEQFENSVSVPARLSILVGLSAKAKSAAGKVGNQKKWAAAGLDLDDCKAGWEELHLACETVLESAREYRRQLVGFVVGKWVNAGVEERLQDGTVEFHDLLVLARSLLTDKPHVRRALHQRYTRVLLDEFQDTDPIQLEIAVRLTADPAAPNQAPDADWRQLQPLPGRLFIVGDPKQSIYRFRRADIAQYLAAAEQLKATERKLTANFRSSAAVIEWVNATFSKIIVQETDVQPPYKSLEIERRGQRNHGTVHVLHPQPIEGVQADELRELEATEVVATITTALADGWLVGCEDCKTPAKGEDCADHLDGLRPCRPADICILLPARSSLRALERALQAANLPYRAENSSVVYETAEIRELMLVLRASDDLTDELSLVAALRTPLYGVSDVELYEWRQAGGRWNIFGIIPDGFEQHPVALAYDHLRQLHRARPTSTPSELLSRIVDDRRVLEAALDSPLSRDVWRRVRFVIEQARAWNDSGGRGLRRYLRWVARQANESRSADTVLPETDHDAIRIMTVHAAKGLEFPITVLSGMSSKPQGTRAWSVVWTTNGWGFADKDDDQFSEAKPLDEQMSDAERRRLLYVACTRAVDHLVVSMYHKYIKASKTAPAHGELMLVSQAHQQPPAVVADYKTQDYSGAKSVLSPAPALAIDQWRQERSQTVKAASRRLSVSATSFAADISNDVLTIGRDGSPIDPGIDKEPVNLDLPAWKRGRYGTAIGRAVHAVLQYCDLATGDDIAQHAKSQCAAEQIFGFDDTVAALARSAVDSDIIKLALQHEHHRELYVAANIGGIVYEGYIDLFIETPAGGIIVDYKTDQWSNDTHRAQRIQQYRRQLAVYGVALEQIINKKVEQAFLLRCQIANPAESIEIDGWSEVLNAVRSSAAPSSAGQYS